MSTVYVLRYSLCCGTELVSCYDSMYGVTKRIQMMELHDSFTEDESIHIEKMEVISDEEATDRYNNIRKHYANKWSGTNQPSSLPASAW